MRKVVIASGVRTPFGRFGGSLKDFDPYDLSAIVLSEVVKRAGIEKKMVDEIFWGVGDTASCKDVYTPVLARQALLKAGFPPETNSLSLDKACVSAMSAIQLGFRAIRAGDIDIAIGGGVTTFSKIPYVLRDIRWNPKRLGHINLEDPLFALGYKDFNPVAVDAGEVAIERGVSREEQDIWALNSHKRYGKAHAEGKFKDEMMPLEIKTKDGTKILEIDEQYREDTTLEKLSRLKPVYGSPTITAGNAPGLNDGAAAVLIMAEEKAKELGIDPIGEIIEIISTAMEPRYIAEVPAKAIDMVLKKANMHLSDMKLIEINEAFAAMPLVSTKLLCEKYFSGDEKKLEELRAITNVNGGAIAIGHPNTASGARLVMTIAFELKRRGGGLGVCAICGGLAQGDATIVKV